MNIFSTANFMGKKNPTGYYRLLSICFALVAIPTKIIQLKGIWNVTLYCVVENGDTGVPSASQ
jgi:hypothetical protein